MIELWHGLRDLLTTILVFFSRETGSYALGIVLLTVAIRLVLFPLYRAQLQSMKKMQLLQPELKRIQERYKDDKQRLAQEQMQLYQKSGINPLASCWPMLLQLPLLYAIYGVLEHFGFSVAGGHIAAGFLWLPNMGKADPYLILPILGGAATYWQTRISMAMQPGTGQQQMAMMSYLMPVIMFFVFRRLPSGLALYWVVSTLMTVAQQYLTVGSLGAPSPADPDPSAPTQGPGRTPKK